LWLPISVSYWKKRGASTGAGGMGLQEVPLRGARMQIDWSLLELPCFVTAMTR
jgi:hypothetical protein